MDTNEMELRGDNYWVGLQYGELNIDDIESLVCHDSCGAVLSFTGRTRNNFEGKTVVQLCYECYIPMALKEMENIILDLQRRDSKIRIAMYHRLGEVGVGEASVIISIATPHRILAYEASRYAIDTLKSQVPIFKKEVYEGGSTWKANQP